MIKTRKMALKHRCCDCCQSKDVEALWHYEHTTTTRTLRWLFDVHNVICKNCGFIFTSPVADKDELNEYYKDSFVKYKNQALDYDIDKRTRIIKSFFPDKGRVFFEVGSNSKSKFHLWLEDYFEQVITMDPNEDAESDYDIINPPNLKEIDCIAHYFVLEHIPDPKSFLKKYAAMLKDGGIMVCEVPSLALYSNWVSPLILFEHVNHFTPNKLSEIAASVGLNMIFSSEEDCSRPYGFLAVFRKGEAINSDLKPEYNLNKKLFNEGLSSAKLFFDSIDGGWDFIKKTTRKDEPIIIWAANETTNYLLGGKKVPPNVYVIDSNPKKINYLGNTKVYKPTDCVAQIKAANKIIICTCLHEKDILKFISSNFKVTIQTL